MDGRLKVKVEETRTRNTEQAVLPALLSAQGTRLEDFNVRVSPTDFPLAESLSASIMIFNE